MGKEKKFHVYPQIHMLWSNITFDLKHYIVFVKIKPPTGHITFWIFWHFWPIGGHWKKRIQKMKTIFLIAETAMGSPLDRCQSENL